MCQSICNIMQSDSFHSWPRFYPNACSQNFAKTHKNTFKLCVSLFARLCSDFGTSIPGQDFIGTTFPKLCQNMEKHCVCNMMQCFWSDFFHSWQRIFTKLTQNSKIPFLKDYKNLGKETRKTTDYQTYLMSWRYFAL